MHNDEVPFQAPAGAREIAPEVSILVPVAIGDAALMLHAKVRSFNHLEPVFIKRIWAEPVFKMLHGLSYIGLHVSPRIILTVVHHPVFDIKAALFARIYLMN